MTTEYWVYILASKRNGTLYVGLTNDLSVRVFQHRSRSVPSFTKKYDVTRLVHFEQFQWIHGAKHRETQLKRWRRAWKIELIERNNPDWADLYETLRID